MKRIVTIQDISGVGKCSVTIAHPLVSAMGVECSVVPTAVLSTHTMFSGAYIRDLTADIPHILAHWEEEEFYFDAVYTGYLGSFRQLALVGDFIDRFGEDVTTYANDMTSFRAVVNIAVSHVFYSWVFGFGGKVKIKGPDNVKEKYAEMLNAAVKGLE